MARTSESIERARAEFAEQAKGLPWTGSLSGRVIAIEPISADYFRSPDARQRCIVEIGGKRYLAFYD